jgi:hypothetical protein
MLCELHCDVAMPLFRGKKSATAAQRVDRCPHAIKPACGLFAENAVCNSVSVDVQIDNNEATTTITCSYTMNGPLQGAWISFPVSEFGRVHEQRVTLGGASIAGRLFRRGADNETWTPSDHPEFHAAASSHAPNERRIPPIYAFRANDVPSPSCSGRTSTTTRLVVEIKSAMVTDSEGVRCFALPYTCCPKAPTQISMKARMASTIRTVTTPNRSLRVHPIIRGKRADIIVDVDAVRGAPVEDYLFIVQIELGAPLRPECADPVALLILVTAVAVMVFFGLTHALEEDF